MTHTRTSRTATIIAGLGLAAAVLSAQTRSIRADTAPTSALASSALITIPDPHEAALLHLHGYTGAGTALIQIDGQCYSMPVRIVAGDFGGKGITIDQGGPIRLRIMNPEMIRTLHEGRDLVSEGRAVVASASGDAPDIVVEAGLPAGTGFVINAGSSVLADIFGSRPNAVPCAAAEIGISGRPQVASETR